MQFHFAKTEPAVGVELPRLFKTMTEQTEHNDAAAAFQNATRRRHRPLRFDCVMQGLTEQDKIDALFRDRRIFQIAEAILEIFEAVLLRKPRTELHHFWRVIDCDYFARAFREQL